jgi:hypothetical protein
MRRLITTPDHMVTIGAERVSSDAWLVSWELAVDPIRVGGSVYQTLLPEGSQASLDRCS